MAGERLLHGHVALGPARRRPGRPPRAAERTRGPSSRKVSARKRSSCSTLSTSPWRRYSPAWATAPAGASDSSVISASGSASPPSASSAMPALGAARAQRVEAARPAAPPTENAAQHDAGAVEHVLDQRVVVGRDARVGAADLGEVVRQPLDRPRRGEDLGVGGGYEAKQGRTSVIRSGSPAGGPWSISSASRSVSRWCATRSPSTSSRASRAAANVDVAGHEVAPALRRPSRTSSARRKESCSSAPCQEVPSTAPARQPSGSPSSPSSSASPPWRVTRPWRIS